MDNVQNTVPAQYCSKYGELKPLTEFHYRNKQKGLLQSSCKVCSCKYQKQYRQDNRDRIREYQHQYYLVNHDEILDYRRQYYLENRDYCLEARLSR